MAELSIRTRRLALAFAGWTLFTWVTRLPLAWSDDELTTGEKALATVPVALFVVLALVSAVLVLLRRSAARSVLLAFAVWTVAYWAVRMVLIAAHGHPAGFVAVHAVLALVASTLAVLTGRSARADGTPATGPRIRRGGRRASVAVDV